MRQTVVESERVRLRLVVPPPDLAPFLSLYYVTEILPGPPVEDWLPPEGANLRVGRADVYQACVGEGELRPVPSMILAGPTSRAARVRLGEGVYPGVGILPLGFAKFLGVPTSDYANRVCDIDDVPAAVTLRAVMADMFANADDIGRMVESLNAHFRALLGRPVAQADTIVALHAAIVSDAEPSVTRLAWDIGVSARTVERLCAQHFGFSPQMLLRRQRFLRSLARFMIDPSMKWIDTIDTHYHDQAHFVRDFKHFMMMRPSEFAPLPHPVVMTAVRARRIMLGDPMQMLHTPDPIPAVAATSAAAIA